jgi:hypothetical protein
MKNDWPDLVVGALAVWGLMQTGVPAWLAVAALCIIAAPFVKA